MTHVRNVIVGVSEMIWILTPLDFVWSQTLVYGASVLRDIYRYPPNTRRYKLLGQRVGFFGERICFGGSMNFGKSNPACGISLQVNLIAEIASIIKLTSALLLSWAYLAISLPVYCFTHLTEYARYYDTNWDEGKSHI